ncbi:hypothetical protein SKAU_G00339390 [Synaphobranchus kaupii]|uniref:Uncharacterized protein n=1 Tax=Synaphobranchus kaupii TaxID=118154 RepID=A0A9Q1EMQ0_SYNKA|nr:hypothetical protein SKAU_G00339390 [Synaphobranchus kaupii]
MLVCGDLIAARDTHPLCVTCLVLKHAQDAIEASDCCSHYLALPRELRQWRLRVAATHARAYQSDPDSSDLPLSLSRTPILEGEAPYMAIASNDLGEKDSIPPARVAPAMGMANAQCPVLTGLGCSQLGAAGVLLEACEWPALQKLADEERDVYDGKLTPRKQLFCAKHMKHHCVYRPAAAPWLCL